jgi:phospholipase C
VLWVAKWVCKVFAWIEVHIFCGLFFWIFVLAPIWLLCVGLTELKCLFFSIFGGKVATNKIEHVFVLFLENRSFDHIFGFSDFQRG